MKRKTEKLIGFIDGLHKYITNNPQFRRDTNTKTEVQIQTELRPLLIRYLEKFFKKEGYKDFVGKANKSFYWEGQEGRYGKDRSTLFGSRNYPDFIITEPYLVAVEYKQSSNGSTVKRGIGQSIMLRCAGTLITCIFCFMIRTKTSALSPLSSSKPNGRC